MFVGGILIAKPQKAFSMTYEWNWITTRTKMAIHRSKIGRFKPYQTPATSKWWAADNTDRKET